jgi:enamine deaminase RidA (YjgF/YER057c/UK114 family)
MQHRQNIPAGTQWANKLCYSRAVRIGPFVAVSQTSAVNRAGKIAGGSDPYRQAVYALKNIERALREAGVKLTDVIRTRIYLARFEDWEAVARAHAEAFEGIRPAVSLVTCRMISPEILVEFEADAIANNADWRLRTTA